MHRRRYLVLASAVLLAGCESDDGGDGEGEPTETATPSTGETATESPTETEGPGSTETETDTETETETEDLTGEERATAEIESARSAIEEGYDSYLSSVDGARTLLDVHPGTLDFPVEDTVGNFEAALDHLETARDHTSDDDQEELIGHLTAAATWLQDAAAAQVATSEIANALDAASTAGANTEGYEAIEGHLEDAQSAVPAAREAIDAIERPEERPFYELGQINRDTVVTKHDRLQRERVGVGNLGNQLANGLDAVATLHSANVSFDAEQYDDAADSADDAASAFRRAAGLAADINPSSMQGMTDLFGAAMGELETIARDLRSKARNA